MPILSGKNTYMEHQVYETEHHVHNWNHCLGALAVPAGGKVGQYGGITPYTITSGNNAFGAWHKIIDINDTPKMAGKKYYDFNTLYITDVPNTASGIIHRFQIAFSAVDADTGYNAGDYTGLALAPIRDGGTAPFIFIMDRVPVGTMAWIRSWVAGLNAQTTSFFCGIHEYTR